MTRKEIIDKAVEYLRTAKKPNMVIDASPLADGCIGLKMWGELPEDSRKLSFPLVEKNTQTVTSVSVYDRLSFMTLFDKCSDALVVQDPVSNEAILYSPSFPAQSFRIANKMTLTYPSIAFLIQHLVNTNNKPYFDKLFLDIADTAYPKPTSPLQEVTAPPVAPVAPVEEVVAQQLIVDDKWDVVEVRDRLDLISCIDSISIGKKIAVASTTATPWLNFIVVEEEKAVICVKGGQGLTLPSATVLSKYHTVQDKFDLVMLTKTLHKD